MDTVFFLKKLISLFLDPVAFVLGLLFWGGVCAALARLAKRREKRRAACFFRRTGMIFVVTSALLLYLGSLGGVAEKLTRSLEESVTENIDEAGEYRFETEPSFVVVLGGGQRSVPGKPTLSGLTRHAMARVVGGVDLWKRYPSARFVVTGHPVETRPMREIAIRLGVPAEKIVTETESQDTKDHPVYLRPILGEEPFLLVTSATHMPRAAGLFRGQGLEPMLAPVDFQSWPKTPWHNPYALTSLAPESVNLYRTAIAMHEYIGLFWAKLRGQMAEEN